MTPARFPKGMPKWVSRRVQGTAGAIILGAIVLFVAVSFLIQPTSSPSWLTVVFITLLLALPPGAFALRHVCRRVRATNGMVCPTCGKDLQGTPDAASCPKCKVDYPAGEIRKVWDEWCPACWDIEEMDKRPA